jgi:hypothetical protein
VLLLPEQPGPYPDLAVAIGKEGSIYLLNRDNLGKYDPSGDTQVVQELPNAIGGVWGMPAYFNGAVYFWGNSGFVVGEVSRLALWTRKQKPS